MDDYERNVPELFVPKWYRAAALAQALAPGLVRRLGGGGKAIGR